MPKSLLLLSHSSLLLQLASQCHSCRLFVAVTVAVAVVVTGTICLRLLQLLALLLRLILLLSPLRLHVLLTLLIPPPYRIELRYVMLCDVM